jgi:hypothetical protein
MPVSTTVYGNAIVRMLNKEIDWDSDTIRVMLCTESYTPNQDTHTYKSSVTNELAGANGYSTGGAALTGCSIAYNAGTNVVTLDADDVVWSNSTLTARYAVIYDDTATNDPLIAWVDFGQNMSSNNSTFQITWNAGGIITITVA